MNPARKSIRTDHWIAAILLFVMSAIAFVNVLSRYLFHFSFAATEELTINLFVWLTVVGSRMLMHLLLHGMQHRSEAAALLTSYGQNPGDLDFIFFEE